MKKAISTFLKTTSLAFAMAVIGPIGMASTEIDETISATGISGSFLASRVAIVNNDDAVAVKFLERAMELDPENRNIQKDLFISLVANGRVEEAAELAKEIREIENENILVAVVNAVEAIRKRSWKKALTSLQAIDGTDLDNMIREISSAWSMFGAGDTDGAIERVNALEGPEWIEAIRDYHAGLIAAASGADAIATEKLQSVMDNRRIIRVLTETFVRAIEAQARLQSHNGDAEAARKAVGYGRSILPNHPPFLALEKALEEEKVLAPLITSAQGGVAELFFNLATAIKRDGGTAFAKTYLQLANYLKPETDVTSIAIAELYLQQQRFEDSNALYETVADDSPFHRIAGMEMASNLARLEKKDEAVTLLTQLIDEDPDDLTGYMTLGRLHSRDKEYREAADIYDRAVSRIRKSERHHWNLFFRRGIAYERLKEWEKAEPNFKTSLELAPNQAEVLNYLGYSWIDMGINLEEGLDMVKKAVELQPRSGFIVDSLGWAYYRLGKYDLAVEELERAAQIMPQDPTINDHLGDAYWRAGRKLEATFQWKIALSGEPPLEDPKLVRQKLAEGLPPPEDEAGQ